MVLFRPTEVVDHDAIGTLSICRSRDSGRQYLARLTRARKTSEATVQRTTGETVETMLDTATPVIAVIP